jgi:hypothetical protein
VKSWWAFDLALPRRRHGHLDGPAAADQVGVLGVAAQVGADERAQGHELEAAGAEVGQGAGDQAHAEPLPLQGRIDLGVDQQDGQGSDR